MILARRTSRIPLQVIALTLLIVFVVAAGPSSAGTEHHLWSYRFGGPLTDNGLGVNQCADGCGSTLISGNFADIAEFGGPPMTSAGAVDIFVMKLDARGHGVWSRRFGGVDNDQGYAVTTDIDENVYITGNFRYAVDFGGGAFISNGNYDIFLLKLDRNGNYVWSKHFGGTAPDYGRSLDVDSQGNVVMTGLFGGGMIDFGGAPLVSAGNADIFVAKFAPDGAHVWSHRLGGAAHDYGYRVCAGPDNEVIVTGEFGSAMDFGDGVVVPQGNTDAYIVKFDADGNAMWSRQFGDFGRDNANGVAIDKAGNVALTGYFQGKIDVGGGALTSAGLHDVFIVHFDPDGSHHWSRRLGGAESDYGMNVATDLEGNVYAIGRFEGTVEFPGGSATSEGESDIYLIKYGGDGTHEWDSQFGGGGFDNGTTVGFNVRGHVIITGRFSKDVDFGGGPLSSAGSEDIFVASYKAGEGAPDNPPDRKRRIDLTLHGFVPENATSLAKNYPNPFNPSTSIAFTLDQAERAMLQVYDVRGRLVTTLVDEVRGAGPHAVIWNGHNAAGRHVSTGVYFCVLRAGGETFRRKMTLLR